MQSIVLTQVFFEQILFLSLLYNAILNNTRVINTKLVKKCLCEFSNGQKLSVKKICLFILVSLCNKYVAKPVSISYTGYVLLSVF